MENVEENYFLAPKLLTLVLIVSKIVKYSECCHLWRRVVYSFLLRCMTLVRVLDVGECVYMFADLFF